MGEQVSRLRADAQDNRDRIVLAARALFAERGLDVTMREIARRAEVGPATLYRRFPTKRALVDDIFTGALEVCREVVAEGEAHRDPWNGLETVVRRLVVANSSDRGLIEALTSQTSAGTVVNEHRRELLARIAQLAARAQRTGQLRLDFTIDDLVVILVAGRAAAGALGRARGEEAAARFASVAIDGLRAQQHHR